MKTHVLSGKFSVMLWIFVIYSHFFSNFLFRSVNIFWKLLRKDSMVGSGVVQMDPNVYIDMHCHQALC